MAFCDSGNQASVQQVQYWNNKPNWGGDIAVMDSCPTYATAAVDCRFGNGATIFPGSPDTDATGQTIGNQSACFGTTVAKMTNGFVYYKAACYKHECTSDKLRVFVARGAGQGDWVDCPVAGGSVEVNNTHNYWYSDATTKPTIVCPEFSNFCGKFRGLGIPPSKFRASAVSPTPPPTPPAFNSTYASMTCMQLKMQHRGQGCCGAVSATPSCNELKRIYTEKRCCGTWRSA